MGPTASDSSGRGRGRPEGRPLVISVGRWGLLPEAPDLDLRVYFALLVERAAAEELGGFRRSGAVKLVYAHAVSGSVIVGVDATVVPVRRPRVLRRALIAVPSVVTDLFCVRGVREV